MKTNNINDLISHVEITAFARTHNPCPAYKLMTDIYIQSYIKNKATEKEDKDYLKVIYDGLVTMYQTIHEKTK